MVKQQLQPNGNSLSKGKPPIFVVLSIKKSEEVERRNSDINVDLLTPNPENPINPANPASDNSRPPTFLYQGTPIIRVIRGIRDYLLYDGTPIPDS